MVKPKFLFVTDNTSFDTIGVRYIGPYRLAYELEQHGITTCVIDRFYNFPDFFSYLENVLTPDFIGIGLSTTFMTPPKAYQGLTRFSDRSTQARPYSTTGIIDPDLIVSKEWFKKLSDLMKLKSPNAKIFLGGTKAHRFSRPPLNSIQEIDYIVMGAVDSVFPAMINDLLSTGDIQHQVIGGKKIVDTAAHYKQVKSCPAHEWLPHWGIQKYESLPIEISRGCVFNCKYCNYDKNESSRKTPNDLKLEFTRNFETYGTQFYHFVDDCFNDSRKKVEEVCNAILSLPFQIEWISYARFDVAVKFPETAQLMVESGAKGLFWGVESLTGNVARKAGKGTDPEKIKDFITKFFSDYGNECFSTGSFICGLPGETEESWALQMEWLMAVENFHFVQFGPLSVLPFRSEFDGRQINYADYSRNPQKHGFLELDLAKSYWRHATMDSTKALELVNYSSSLWKEKIKDRKGLANDVWIYPALRSLGLSKEELYQCYFPCDPKITAELRKKIAQRAEKRLNNYFSGFKIEHSALHSSP